MGDGFKRAKPRSYLLISSTRQLQLISLTLTNTIVSQFVCCCALQLTCLIVLLTLWLVGVVGFCTNGYFSVQTDLIFFHSLREIATQGLHYIQGLESMKPSDRWSLLYWLIQLYSINLQILQVSEYGCSILWMPLKEEMDIIPTQTRASYLKACHVFEMNKN